MMKTREISEISEINNRILAIWEDEFKNKTSEGILVPLLFNNFNKNGLLTIGINPSYSEKNMPKLIKYYNSELKEDLSEEDFKWSENNTKNNKVIAYDEWSKKNYPFFNKFHEIASSVFNNGNWRNNWEHIDLFFYRHTSQKEFLEKKLPEFKEEFIEKQKNLLKEIITLINPKIILIANAKASEIFKGYFRDLIDDFNVKDSYIGTYILNIQDKKIPLFLSSMLSGGPTSNESYKRLIWHIHFVKNKMESTNMQKHKQS